MAELSERKNNGPSPPLLNGKQNSVPEGYTVLREGLVDILQHGNDVFYNKAQIINRDISIAVLRMFKERREEEALEGKGKKQQKKASSGGKGREVSSRGPAPGSVNTTENEAECIASTGVVDETKFCNGKEASKLAGNLGRVTEDASRQAEQAETSTAPEDHAGGAVAPTLAGVPLSGSGEHGEENRTGSRLTGASTPEPVRVLEALAASGLRAIRYAREVEGLGLVTAIDLDKLAVEACRRNVQFNGLDASHIEVHEADARVFMLTHEKEFHMVDLDPYGSPSVYLDSAVQAVADGGLLACTATDMAVLCGNNAEVSYSKYGAYALRGKHCHEMALRILLASIESAANRYKRHIVPVLSLSIDFYIRVFVRIYTSAIAVKESPSKLAYVFQCVGCDSFHMQPVGRITQKNNSTRYMPAVGPTVGQTCDGCSKHFNLGGPIWAAPMHDPSWVTAMLARVSAGRALYPAFNKIHSILTAVSEELVDVPLYLSLHAMSAVLKCTPPSAALFRSAVVNAGFRISGSHANPLGLKTDAPMDVLWDIMRCWVRDHPVKAQPEESPGFRILSKEPKLQANFTRVHNAMSRAQANGVARFLPNPEHNWGPKPKAGRLISSRQDRGQGAALGEEREAKRPRVESTEDAAAGQEEIEEIL